MREFHVLNLGAGVQSTALALMAHINAIPEWLPRIDYALFADTQREPRAVYDHLRWLMELTKDSFPTLIRTKGDLGSDLVNGINSTGQRFVSIPAFTAEVEGDAKNAGMMRRQCTKEYKTEVIERAIRRDIVGMAPRQQMPKDVIVHQYLGLSYDEPGRIFGRGGKPGAKARIESNRWARAHFPLYDLYMTRAMCEAWLETQKIPHVVPRSACTFCPYRSNTEWLRMRDSDPESWQDAVSIDRAIRHHDSTRARAHVERFYVHRDCVPLDQVDLTLPDPKPTQQDLNFSAFECEGMCGV